MSAIVNEARSPIEPGRTPPITPAPMPMMHAKMIADMPKATETGRLVAQDVIDGPVFVLQTWAQIKYRAFTIAG